MSTGEYDILCLVFNVCLWLFAFLFYQYKHRYFGLGSGILLFYTFVALFSVHLYYSPYKWMFKSLSLFPFVYLLIMILLATYPILYLDERKIEKIQPPSHILFDTVCLLVIIFSFIKLPETLISVQENLLTIIIDETAGAQAYNSSTGGYVSKSASEGNILSIISGMCCSVSFAFFCYYLTIRRKNKFILIGLLLSTLLQPLYGISHGSRSGIASFILNFIFVMLFLKPLLPKEYKIRILKAFIPTMFLLLIPFIAVTLSRRSGDMEMAALSIERYFAEGPLRFNNYGLDAGGIRYGDNTVVALKKIAGLDPAMYYSGRLAKYRDMKIDESVFYTFVGDFTLDFGPLGALIIFVFGSIILRRLIYIKNKRIYFWQYLLIYVVLVSCLGYYQFPFGRETGNAQLIMFSFLIALFWCDSHIKNNKINRCNRDGFINNNSQL